MNKLEYTVNLVGEEASEVAQACNKILRFGLVDVDPRNGRTNLVNLFKELNDLEGVLRLMKEELEDRGISAPQYPDEVEVQKKIQKVLHYAQRSITSGALTADEKDMAAPTGAA